MVMALSHTNTPHRCVASKGSDAKTKGKKKKKGGHASAGERGHDLYESADDPGKWRLSWGGGMRVHRFARHDWDEHQRPPEPRGAGHRGPGVRVWRSGGTLGMTCRELEV